MPPKRGRLYTLATPPPRSTPLWHRLLVVPRDGTIRVLALGEAVTGLMRHFVRATGRMHACTSPHEPCLHCAAGLGAIWSGYVAVASREGERWVGRTLVVPQEAFRNSPLLQSGPIRGRWLHAWRMVARHNGPVRITVGEQAVSPDRVMADWDIEEELAVRFGLKDRADAEEAREA